MPNPNAFVILDEAASVDAARFSESLTARHPNVPLVMPGGDGKGAIVLNFAGSLVAVMQVQAPLPDGWQIAARRAAMYWPDADIAFARHRAHMIVSVMGESRDHLQTARIITAVTGALAAAHPVCSGILWAGEVANSSGTFVALSQRAFAPYPDFPSALWIATLPFQDPGTSVVGAVTVGLGRFVGREIEIAGARSQLEEILATARGLADLLLQPGVELKDGDTISESANERITVRLTDSPRFRGIAVFAIRLPTT
jgi:Domain of unknown function (DUF4261)